MNRYRFKSNASLALTVSLLLLTIGEVHAHAMLSIDGSTPPRYNSSSIKTFPPCGDGASDATPRTNHKAIFHQHDSVTLNWIETVNHGGSYVFDFAPANDLEFEKNAIATVADTQNASASVTLPHVYTYNTILNFNPCTDCTLRMRQDMENAKSYYYSCADIAIVANDDTMAPGIATNIAPTPTSTSVKLDWINPSDPDLYKILIIRSSAALSTPPNNLTDYALGESLGNGTVVYKGNNTTFTDNNLSSETEYTYTIVALDSNYNYGVGVEQLATTTVAPTGGSTSSQDSGGAIFSLLFILLGLSGIKLLQRKV